MGNRYWIAVVFFLLAAAPGSWFPVLSNVLHAKGWDAGIIEWAFVIPPLAGILSPLAFAAKADRSFPAEKVLAVVLAGGAGILFAAPCLAWLSGCPVWPLSQGVGVWADVGCGGVCTRFHLCLRFSGCGMAWPAACRATGNSDAV